MLDHPDPHVLEFSARLAPSHQATLEKYPYHTITINKTGDWRYLTRKGTHTVLPGSVLLGNAGEEYLNCKESYAYTKGWDTARRSFALFPRDTT